MRSLSANHRLRNPGAVVIGGDYQGLAIVRSLGRHGIETIVVDDQPSVSRASRYTSAFVRVADLRSDEATVAALLGVAKRCRTDNDHPDRPVVFPTREETVAALSRRRDELLGRYRVPTPPWEVIKWAWDKRNTYARASALGIPVPRTWTLRHVDDLDSIEGDPPFVIKPAIKEHFFYSTRAKAWRADSRADLNVRVREAMRLVGTGEVMVQELIPGCGDDQLAYCAFFKDGRSVARMVVRRLRQHPMEFGRASTYVQTISDSSLDEPSESFLRSIDYYGLVELEYKHDRRDGQTKLLDVNARTWGYHSLGRRAGIDFPYALYADQLGLPGPDGEVASPGVTWIRLVTDLPTAAVEAGRGRLRWREYLRTVRRFDTESVFSLEDPLPGLTELALLPYSALRRGF